MLSSTALMPASAFLLQVTTGRQEEGTEWVFCPDCLSASRAKVRGALSTSSNGLPAINNPSLYSTADQTEFIAPIQVPCMWSELQIHATERIAGVFELMHILVSGSHEGAALCRANERALPAQEKCVGLSVIKTRLL